MRGNRGGRNDSSGFGDPFAGFGGLGGLGGHRSLGSSFFGGRDPFDDPFFTRPFGGGMLEPNFLGYDGNPYAGGMFESNSFGFGGNPYAGGMLESNLFGYGGNPYAGGLFESNFFSPIGSAFPGIHPSGFLRHEAPYPQSSRGPVIEELNSDDEKEKGFVNEVRGNSRKDGRLSNKPLVEVPDEATEDKRSRQLHLRVDNNRLNNTQSQPQTRSFSFQSSTSVTYGGANGAYYTSSRTRRAGSDGVTFEEIKEADSSSGQATHKLSRGLHNKGHSLTRKLNSDGKVDTLQTLHNLEEDELPRFEEAWKGNARRHLPGLNENFIGHDGSGSSGGPHAQANRGGWALPFASTQRTHSHRGMPDNPHSH